MKSDLKWKMAMSVLLGLSSLEWLPQVQTMPGPSLGSAFRTFSDLPDAAASGRAINEGLTSFGDGNTLRLNSDIVRTHPSDSSMTANLQLTRSRPGGAADDSEILGLVSDAHIKTAKIMANMAQPDSPQSSIASSRFPEVQQTELSPEIPRKEVPQQNPLKQSGFKSNPLEDPIQPKTTREIPRNQLPQEISENLLKYANDDPEFGQVFVTYAGAQNAYRTARRATLQSADQALVKANPDKYREGLESVMKARENTLSNARDISRRQEMTFDEIAERLKLENAYIREAISENEAILVPYSKSLAYLKNSEEAFGTALKKLTTPQSTEQTFESSSWKTKLSLSNYFEKQVPEFKSLAVHQRSLEKSMSDTQILERNVVNRARAGYESDYLPTRREPSWIDTVDNLILQMETADARRSQFFPKTHQSLITQAEFEAAKMVGPNTQEFKAALKKAEVAKQEARVIARDLNKLEDYKMLQTDKYEKQFRGYLEYSNAYRDSVEAEKVARQLKDQAYQTAIQNSLQSSKSSILDAVEQRRISILDISLHNRQNNQPLSANDARLLQQDEFVNQQAQQFPEVMKLKELADQSQKTFNEKLAVLSQKLQ